jgi:NAD/NADP transhydrogenase beta subunit
MFYLVALGLFVLCYLFLASDEIKKSLNLFVVIIGTVLAVTIVISLIVQNKTTILQGLIVLAGLGLMVESIREINQL